MLEQTRARLHRTRTVSYTHLDAYKRQRLYGLDAAFHAHCLRRCGCIPLLKNDYRELTWQTDKTWLEAQALQEQREILGTQRYALWKTGRVRLEDFVSIKQSEVWGDSFYPTPVKHFYSK